MAKCWYANKDLAESKSMAYGLWPNKGLAEDRSLEMAFGLQHFNDIRLREPQNYICLVEFFGSVRSI